MLKPILCDYSDAHMLKRCAPLTDCMKSTQVHNAEDINVVIPIYNLIVIIIQRCQEVYGSIMEMDQF